MHDSRSRPLVVALAVSVALHVLVALVAVAWASAAVERDDPTRPQRERLLRQELRLGSDTATTTSMTWIGFEEYQEHFATAPADVDQPELTMDPAPSPMPMEAEPVVTPVPIAVQPSEAPPAESSNETTSETMTSETTTAHAPVPEQAVDGAPSVEPEPSAASTAAARTPDAAPIPLVLPFLGPGAVLLAAEASDATADEAMTGAEEHAGGAPATGAARPESPPTPAATPRTQAADPGRAADRESIAAAIRTAAVVQWGKPLTSKGLRIRTIRPRFTHLTQLTASPVDPVVRIWFDRKGAVWDAVFLRSSGNPNVDRPILDAVFRWRATGKALEALRDGEPPETITVDIRMSL